ncbi:gas vesicle protein GvpG [Kitasatospora sp. NPDC127111]|uniref:gas vesicle protein GvpG n=1 Tax=Kitasatospora sp. NPDC127111 TaxID=3345363 RepID=UPI003639BB85
MGLITVPLAPPLAPVRGVVRVAEQLDEQAGRELSALVVVSCGRRGRHHRGRVEREDQP